MHASNDRCRARRTGFCSIQSHYACRPTPRTKGDSCQTRPSRSVTPAREPDQFEQVMPRSSTLTVNALGSCLSTEDQASPPAGRSRPVRHRLQGELAGPAGDQGTRFSTRPVGAVASPVSRRGRCLDWPHRGDRHRRSRRARRRPNWTTSPVVGHNASTSRHFSSALRLLCGCGRAQRPRRTTLRGPLGPLRRCAAAPYGTPAGRHPAGFMVDAARPTADAEAAKTRRGRAVTSRSSPTRLPADCRD